MSDITYMQDITTSACANSIENETKRLIDKKDNKKYWVAKLADGNCWMTQNLALDLSTTVALTSADSDVASNWTPQVSTGDNEATVTEWGYDWSSQKSYNPGEYVYTTPTTPNNCSGTITSLFQCKEKGWNNVMGWQASDDSTFAIVVDVINHTYNAHYLAGNYYTYAAATAGTAPGGSGTASSSICPKGWQLPSSNSTTVNKSFGYLLTQYKVQNNVIGSMSEYDVRTIPLYLLYGGVIISNGVLSSVGDGSRYWSSTSDGNSKAYFLYLASTTVNPSISYDRYVGSSVRCVAK